jgi:hypothetical protein
MHKVILLWCSLFFAFDPVFATDKILSCNPQLGVPTDGLPLEAQSFSLAVSKESSFGQLRIRNRDTRGIVGLLILVELRNEAGELSLSLPFYTIDMTSKAPLGASFLQWLRVHDSYDLGGSLSPMGKKSLRGWSPMAVTHCPVAANLTFVQLEYSDGYTFRYASSTWEIQPLLVRALRFSLSGVPAQPPIRLFAQLRVSADGQPEVQSTVPTDVFKDWFQGIVSAWAFAPAMRGGQTQEKGLSMSFRVDLSKPEKNEPPLPYEAALAVSFVRATPHKLIDSDFLIEQGDLPVGNRELLRVR